MIPEKRHNPLFTPQIGILPIPFPRPSPPESGELVLRSRWGTRVWGTFLSPCGPSLPLFWSPPVAEPGLPSGLSLVGSIQLQMPHIRPGLPGGCRVWARCLFQEPSQRCCWTTYPGSRWRTGGLWNLTYLGWNSASSTPQLVLGSLLRDRETQFPYIQNGENNSYSQVAVSISSDGRLKALVPGKG